jgi:hypothetical protein
MPAPFSETLAGRLYIELYVINRIQHSAPIRIVEDTLSDGVVFKLDRCDRDEIRVTVDKDTCPSFEESMVDLRKFFTHLGHAVVWATDKPIGPLRCQAVKMEVAATLRHFMSEDIVGDTVMELKNHFVERGQCFHAANLYHEFFDVEMIGAVLGELKRQSFAVEPEEGLTFGPPGSRYRDDEIDFRWSVGLPVTDQIVLVQALQRKRRACCCHDEEDDE